MKTIGVFAGCRHLPTGKVKGRWWWPTLDSVREDHGITEVWHGACSSPGKSELQGADLIVDAWAHDRGVTVKMFPAPWDLYQNAGLQAPAAGPRRQRDMLHGEGGYRMAHSENDPFVEGRGPDRLIITTTAEHDGPDLMVALPGGKGTKGTMTAARALGVPVVELEMAYRPGFPRVVNLNHYDDALTQDLFPDDRPSSPPEDAIYIGRPARDRPGSPLANPYRVQDHGHRALELYRQHLGRKCLAGDDAVLRALRDIEPDSTLVCYCKRRNGSGACHGDIVVDAWAWMRESAAQADGARGT